MKTKLILILACLTALPTAIADSAHCGTEGVWIEILGAGSGELEDGQGPPSFLLWQDNVARLIVDTGSGSSVGFDRSGACLLYTSPSPRDKTVSRMPSSA